MLGQADKEKNKMDKKVLLWVDLSLRKESRPVHREFEPFFEIRPSLRQVSIDTQVRKPDVVCFNYDYPDKAGLELLVRTKTEHPSIPILMLTVQHSEELAVWAFRARVWDYFVKPLDDEEIAACSDALDRIGRQDGRRPVRELPDLPAENRVLRNSNPVAALLPATEFVSANLGDKITEARVAGLCNMSIYRFSRQFHAAFGQTFQSYLLEQRITKACQLLSAPGVRISDVAMLVGFNDPSYFSRIFRRMHGMTPKQWQHRQLHQSEQHEHDDTGLRLALTAG